MSPTFHLFLLTDTGRISQPEFIATLRGQLPPEHIFGSGMIATHYLLLRPGERFGGESTADILAQFERHGFARVRAFATDQEWREEKHRQRAPLKGATSG